jgi:N-acetylglucosamine-6-sulfatase
MNRFLLLVLTFGLTVSVFAQERPNIIFILADDHRHDFMGFTGAVEGLETPNMDRIAKNGAHFPNAFVTTALCSPSRASILTGKYAHSHTIVDNSAPIPAGTQFFPEILQANGYQTGFLGKWHMGDADDKPQPGFDYWLSFRGQGVYNDPTFNINGKQVKQPKGSYTSDLLTDYALEWLEGRNNEKPFFLYLSHKAVHAEFQPAKRHQGLHINTPVVTPPSMYLTATAESPYFSDREKPITTPVNYKDIPEWVRRQRFSWHGVDHMYHGQIRFDEFYKLYLETLMGVDESVGRVLDWVEKNGLKDDTLIIYMGDNGFSFGEHGLIDKRHAYEESMKVPFLAQYPPRIKAGSVNQNIVMNIDLAPTFLELAGVPGSKPDIQGQSLLPILKNPESSWRDKVFYEYYWEMAFPSTPTIFAVRTEKYKYIFNQGVWDINELYDLEKDPYEMNNLIRSPEHQKIAEELRSEVFTWLETTGGEQIPLKRITNPKFDHKYQKTF